MLTGCLIKEKKIKTRPLALPRGRWQNNFKIDLTEIRLEVWIGLIWPRMGTSGGLL